MIAESLEPRRPQNCGVSEHHVGSAAILARKPVQVAIINHAITHD